MRACLGAMAAALVVAGTAGAAGAAPARAPAAATAAAPVTTPSRAEPNLGELGRATALLVLGRGSEALTVSLDLAGRGAGPAAALAGHILEQGLGGVTADPVEAVRAYRMGAALHDTDCLAAIGRLGAAGLAGVTPGEARAALERIVPGARPDLATLLAGLLIDPAAGTPDPVRAAALYGPAADAGDADAAYALAVLLDDGDPAPPDDAGEARRRLAQASAAGLPAGMADYGLLLYQGRGGPRDLPQAVRLFERAARAGDRDGAFYWALVNARGEGVPQNLPVALDWARQARGASPDADRLIAMIEARMRRSSAPPR